ncbi:ABC transporter permease [Amycolatopsis jiangsuensis]|uniref:Peptide/nickel transport system permease protein n=1 Tax=Amycolatopsis jiangsuensis TaxID=1181879 RepID=A0A840INH7_9PSEU|nr:ABC transporter permease [Amycolatopsis jiangsuensis]MBB4683916.1 peptide/nickel transport system permease protein [Amycolatopsis jiangsuensis]
MKRLGFPLAILVVYVLAALLAPVVAPYDPDKVTLAQRLLAPSGTHLLGTDALGRDVLSRVIYGTQVSLLVAVGAVLVGGVVGIALGVLAGWRGGWLGAVIMRLVDVVLSVPFFLLAILVVAVLGPSLVNVVVCLALVRWPRYARIAHSTTLQARGRGFVRAATATGAGGWWIVLRHVLPEVLPVAIVVGTLELGLMVIYEASLSFLGLGVQPPTASWGSILSDGQQYIASAWWLATFPGVALFILVLAVNLLGDAARDRLDPAKRAELPRARLLRRKVAA